MRYDAKYYVFPPTTKDIDNILSEGRSVIDHLRADILPAYIRSISFKWSAWLIAANSTYLLDFDKTAD